MGRPQNPYMPVIHATRALPESEFDERVRLVYVSLMGTHHPPSPGGRSYLREDGLAPSIEWVNPLL